MLLAGCALTVSCSLALLSTYRRAEHFRCIVLATCSPSLYLPVYGKGFLVTSSPLKAKGEEHIAFTRKSILRRLNWCLQVNHGLFSFCPLPCCLLSLLYRFYCEYSLVRNDRFGEQFNWPITLHLASLKLKFCPTTDERRAVAVRSASLVRPVSDYERQCLLHCCKGRRVVLIAHICIQPVSDGIFD